MLDSVTEVERTGFFDAELALPSGVSGSCLLCLLLVAFVLCVMCWLVRRVPFRADSGAAQ